MFCILHHNIVYLCFLNTASSLFLWHNLVHFGILLSTPAIKTFRREWQSNHGQFLLIKNLDPVRKDFYRQHACNYLLLLTMCTIHFANGLERCVDCTYSGTKFLNSYPRFKEPCHGKLCLQVIIMWHVLLVSGKPQTHSAWLPGGGISRWSGHGISWPSHSQFFWLVATQIATLQCGIVVSKTTARDWK